jgi:hypothetical protein
LAAPTDAQLSLAVNGYSWDAIVNQPWYQTGVAVPWRNMVGKQEVALQSAMDSVVGAAAGKVGASGNGMGGGGVGWMAVLVGMGVLGVLLL